MSVFTDYRLMIDTDMMPRATTPQSSKSPSTGQQPAAVANSNQRPRIGFSIDFLVGHRSSKEAASIEADDGNISGAVSAVGAKKKNDPEDTRTDIREHEDKSTASASPDGGSASSRSASPPLTVPASGSSPLFQSWNPAAMISPGPGGPPHLGGGGPGGAPPYHLDMAALANLRQLYAAHAAAAAAAEASHHRPGAGAFFPPHPHAHAANFPGGPPPPGMRHPPPPPPGGPPGPDGGGPNGGGGLAAQQWWLLAQARQHQQRLFAAAAAASHRFPPGLIFNN